MSRVKSFVLVAFLSSVASAIIHAYLAYHSYELKLGFSEKPSLCNVNDHMNCDAVSLSSYSNLFGIPLAAWGMATHLILIFLLLIWFLGLAQSRDRLLKFARNLAGFIMLMSVVMGLISYFKLSTYCLFCLATYALSVIIFGFLWGASRSEHQEAFKVWWAALWSHQRWILTSVALIPALAFFIHWVMLDSFGVKDLEPMINASLESWKADSEHSFNLEDGFVYQAAPGPTSMVIVEFADFLCPHCKAAFQPLHSFISGHAGTKLVLKIFPLDGMCNPELQGKGENLRCVLAGAAYCAESLNRSGWVAADSIFENQANWSMTSLDQGLGSLAKTVGLDPVALKDCALSSATVDKIQRIASEGKGVNAVPTIFVNGKTLKNGQIPAFLEAAAKTLGL